MQNILVNTLNSDDLHTTMNVNMSIKELKLDKSE